MAVHGLGGLMPFVMALGLMLWASLSSPAWAQALCTEPVAPSCVDLGTTYDAEEELKRCQQDVAKYDQAMTAFAQCLATEANNAAKLRDGLLERFQCLARKEANCPSPPQAGSSL